MAIESNPTGAKSSPEFNRETKLSFKERPFGSLSRRLGALAKKECEPKLELLILERGIPSRLCKGKDGSRNLAWSISLRDKKVGSIEEPIGYPSSSTFPTAFKNSEELVFSSRFPRVAVPVTCSKEVEEFPLRQRDAVRA